MILYSMLSNMRKNKNLQSLKISLSNMHLKKSYLLFKTIAHFPSLKDLKLTFK